MSALLEKYSQCLKAGDAGGVAALFAEDGGFYDDAPSALGFQAIDVKGRQNIEEFFRETFKRGGLQLANVAINGNAMRYDVTVGKTVLLCLGLLTEAKGLIKTYKVVAVPPASHH
ncbi:MAG: hypothetical protein FJ020_05545 [Chloroflexi bacterium]|nr:hypothetical protein [Chloroflexota bacterium]